jgi:phenylacetate-CoA ligase
MHRWLAPMAGRLAGRRMWSELDRMRRLQWLPASEVQTYALERLRGLLAHATAHVPYYRDLFTRAGIVPDDVQTPADLARLPITTKADLRAAFPDGTTAENLPAKRRRAMVTSGSTGMPLEFHWDGACADELLGAHLFSLDWAGAAIWQTRVVVASPAYFYTNATPSPSWRRLARRAMMGEWSESLPANDATAAAFQRLVTRMPRRRGYFIRGYPSAVARIAAGLDEGALPAYPSAVLALAETLTPANAALIGSALRCRVASHYTSWEVPQMAQTCPDNPDTLHVISGRVVLSIVRPDGTPAPTGEPGRVVVTDLANRVMPFINYAVDDTAVAAPACLCGRGLPTVSRIEGRSMERIETPAGRRVGGGMLGQFLVSVAGIVPYVVEYQAEQTAADAVTLRVVPTARFTASTGAQLQRRLQTFLGPDISVDLAVVDSIPLEPSGKRLIIRPHVWQSPSARGTG